MEESVGLPRISTLSSSSSLLLFLEDHFKKREDLHNLPSLLTQINGDCSFIEQNLLEQKSSLSLALTEWISRSQQIQTEIRHLCPCSSSPDKLDGDVRSMLSVELPLLVKEVRRIDTVRLYAETTLKLEGLVGDLEDATLSIVSCTSRNNTTTVHSKYLNTTDSGQKPDKLILAIKAMEAIEEVLSDVAKRRPQWTRFLMAVDSRVEKAFAVLRPKALTDHRVLLSSLGWPPSISTSNIEKGTGMEMLNPLVQMQGKYKENYFSSFLALCALQHLQNQRRARQHELLRYQNGYKLSDSMDIGKRPCLEHGLWVMDELVYPIASRMERHFKHWFDEPKFTFTLVYKMTRDFLDGMDNVLQPLIDKAMIVGCSAREAWVSAMVKFLTGYFERQIFPALARNYDGTNSDSEVSSWLHHIDLMITFDKRMKTLATSGMPITVPFPFEGLSRATSLLSIFVEHSDWLQIWAAIELKDAEEKLQVELDDERNWLTDICQQDELPQMEETESFILSSRKDHKAPLIADSVVRISWAMIERAQSLPTRLLRNQFMRSSVTLFLNHFFVLLLQRCRDLDGTSAILEDDALLRVVGSVNAGRYCESLLQQWTDDISFLEMSVADDNQQHPDSSFFEDEIVFLVKLESDSLVDVMSAILLQFDALCWEYIENLVHLGEEDMILEERNLSVSPGIIDALEMLRDRIDTLRLNLNSQDFVDLWRSIAGGLDHFIFTSISKLPITGVEQFKFDMRALFLIFSPFCARPEAFFPNISDYLKT